MSCSGCRALRKRCSENCSLRSCLQWINSPEAQAHVTLFLAKFFGRSDLISFISSVPEINRPALFQSLLFEACGRTVNPVSGAVGLLWSGNWHVCQAAVETVLAGGVLRPLPGIFGGVLTPMLDESSDTMYKSVYSSEVWPPFMHDLKVMNRKPDFDLSLFPEAYNDITLVAGESEMTSNDSCDGEKKRLLNLFV